MNLHEYQAREILARHGIPLPGGAVATTPEEARAIAARLGGPARFAMRLRAFLRALPSGPTYALEIRNRELVGPDVARALADGGAVACLTVIPTYLIYHVVTPVPLVLALKQIALDSIRVLLMGVVLAWINR